MSDQASKASGGAKNAMPLSGIRVLELGRYLAAPLVGQLLADLGAEVVKVERLGEGDDFRKYSRSTVKDKNGNPTSCSAPYTAANRNKRSVTVDMGQPEGAELVRNLARKCDVLIENFKVGSLAQFGLDYASQRAVNPGVIYLSITGFGQTGPYAQRVATDSIGQAMSGLMDISGERNGEPTKIGTYAADYTTGMYGALAAVAAIRHRDQTGVGQHIDLSLIESTIALVSPRSCEYLLGDEMPTRIGNRTPGTAPGQLYRCADGHVMIQAGSDRMFTSLCKVLERPDILADPRFSTLKARIANIDALADVLESCFVNRTAKEWFDLLGATDVLVAPIYTIAQSLADPQMQARGVRVTIPHPVAKAGSVDVIASPMRFSATPVQYHHAPPPLGEGNEDVLSSWLGYDKKKVDQLRAAGAI